MSKRRIPVFRKNQRLERMATDAQPSDTELLDALEALIQERPLLLWGAPGHPSQFEQACMASQGLSLLNGKRTLREALSRIHRIRPTDEKRPL